VQDNGCGIPEEIRNNIFDPFFTTKGIGVGTGQGLSISRSIIDRHSGEISLSSKPDNGTTFTITLPIGPKGRQQCA
jgi:signal transduction histidine kinase